MSVAIFLHYSPSTEVRIFPFFLIHSFVVCCSPSSATFAYTLLLMHDLAGYKSNFSADTLIQIYPWVVDNFNCYQQEAGRIPVQTPLSRNEWSFVTCWKIEVAKGIIWLELSWQIFSVTSGVQHPMFRKRIYRILCVRRGKVRKVTL